MNLQIHKIYFHRNPSGAHTSIQSSLSCDAKYIRDLSRVSHFLLLPRLHSTGGGGNRREGGRGMHSFLHQETIVALFSLAMSFVPAPGSTGRSLRLASPSKQNWDLMSCLLEVPSNRRENASTSCVSFSNHQVPSLRVKNLFILCQIVCCTLLTKSCCF